MSRDAAPPPEPTPQAVTLLLQSARDGSSTAQESLLAMTYEQLNGLARKHFGSQRQDHTLQPTALVHEAWLKLAGHIEQIQDRQHFFAIASRAMRQVLADHAKGQNRQRRAGNHNHVTLSGVAGTGQTDVSLVELDETLTRLASRNERHARVVELRLFGGLTIEEAATELQVSHATIENDWLMAKAWLRRELAQSP
jgi:RNA polymerase sigma-70 factor (ECF subfamily)